MSHDCSVDGGHFSVKGVEVPAWCRVISRTGLVLALALGAIVVWNGQDVHACDFDEPPPPDEALEEATAVFSGEVVDIVEQNEDPVDRYFAVQFEVERVWKGVEQPDVVVETHVDEGTCGYPFEEGERYLVYAHGAPDELITALYHRTTRWANADQDLEVLGTGSTIDQVVAENGATTAADTEVPLWIYILALFVISLLVATIMVIRRARSAAEQTELD